MLIIDIVAALNLQKPQDTNSGYAMIVEKHINKYERIFAENERKFNRYKHNIEENVIIITNNDTINEKLNRTISEKQSEVPKQSEKQRKTIKTKNNSEVCAYLRKVSGNKSKYVYACQLWGCLYDTPNYASIMKHLRHSHDRKMSRREKKRLRDRAMVQQLEEKYNSITELPERFRIPEWFTDTRSRLTPYFAQIGDEVVYFRRGHQQYIDTVRGDKLYDINPNIKHHKLPNSDSNEIFARVVWIKYVVKPPRLVTLRLNIIDTNTYFSVCYHYVENVADFIILKQLYDKSIACDWFVGNDFRAIIDSKWRFGTITSGNESPLFSYFKCLNVVWANGDCESLSPWDLERIDQQTVPQDRSESVTVTREEMNAHNVWHEHEWPDCGKLEECRRISQGLKTIMELSVAQDFAVAVDLNAQPVYGMTIAYPMDLLTIKSRVDNHYYRSVDAIKFDIRFIESNAREFNAIFSEIVNNAKIVCDLCIRFIVDQHCYDPLPIYLDIMA